jgi:protein phosphatase 1L
LFQKLAAAGLTVKHLPENYAELLTQMYRDVDQTLLARLEAGAGCKKDGATCVNVFCNPNHLLISHVGDSRCVLGYEASGKVEQVTIDHEPDLPAERERVEKKGGKVEFFPNNAGGGVWRVCGDLAMTRSFGDPNVKPFTTCDPDIALRKKGLFEIDAMVVASDGLWHHVTSEEAIKAVRKHDSCEVAGNKLFQKIAAAISKGKSKTFGIDNTMICIVKVSRGSQPADAPRVEKPI